LTVQAIRVAFTLLTRLPVRGGAAREGDLGRSLAFFPLVGCVLGGLLAAVAAMLWSRLPAALLGVGLVALLAGLTGGLHLDGLADVFDGLGGGHGNRERVLAIMRDSRIGAQGAVAIILVLVAKVIGFAGLVERHEVALLVAGPAVARWAVLPLIVFFPYGREEGMGKAFNAQGSAWEVVLATGFIVVLAPWGGWRLVDAALIALSLTLMLGVWMQRRLGGLTGDVYGAAIELAEVVFLMAVQRPG